MRSEVQLQPTMLKKELILLLKAKFFLQYFDIMSKKLPIYLIALLFDFDFFILARLLAFNHIARFLLILRMRTKYMKNELQEEN